MLRAKPFHFFANNKPWGRAEKIKDLFISFFLYKPYNLLVHKHFNELSKIKKKKEFRNLKRKETIGTRTYLNENFWMFFPKNVLLCIVFFSIKLSNSSVVSPGLISKGIFNIIKSKALFVHNHETKELEIDNGVFTCVDISLCLIQ